MDEIVTVSEDEIAAAILALIEKQKVIAEGAGAVSVAAVLFHKLPVEGKKVVCIVSGGNIDVNISQPRGYPGASDQRTKRQSHHCPDRQTGPAAGSL